MMRKTSDKAIKKPSARSKVSTTLPTAEVRIGKFIVHPYRELVPAMPNDNYKNLRDKIQKLRAPTAFVTIDSQDRIIDGRSQLRACLEVEVEPKFDRTTRQDIANMILESMAGTPYTRAQCTLMAARLMDPLIEEAQARQKSGKHLGENFPRGKSADLAAKAVTGTNGKFVRAARLLVEAKSEIVGLIDDGTLPRMNQVITLASMEPDFQRKAISRLRGGESPDLVFAKPKQVDDVWLTPEDIAEAVRAAFYGEIVCDPCSSSEGDDFVRATHAYTIEQDGLKEENPWYDRTFVNPPFSDPKPWIARAIRESALGKRIYLLLPARTGSMHQTAILNEAIDVLFVDKRVAFPKPGRAAKGTGQNAIMIAGLLCSTQPLVDMGIAGTVISAQSSRIVKVGPDGDPVLTKRELHDQDFLRTDEPRDMPEDERVEADALLKSQAHEFDRHVEAGRRAVSQIRLNAQNVAALKLPIRKSE